MSSSTAKNSKSGYGASTSGAGKLDAKAGTSAATEADVPGPLNIPFIKTKDMNKKLPAFSAAVQRSVDDYLPADDLDKIQMELEEMLCSVALRLRLLKSEFECLDKDERRIERRVKQDKQPASPATTSAAAASVTGKRKRDEPTGSSRKPKHTLAPTLKNSKIAKNSPLGLNADDSMDYAPTGAPAATHVHHAARSELHLKKAALPKNDTPNKFWLSVEPYCMPITNEDLRLIDDLLEQYSSPLLPPIPELGPHYSSVWAAEDLKEIQQNSNPNTNANRLKQQNNAPANMLKKADSILDECVTGPLTQRLVSALMEEELIQNTSDLALTLPETSNSSSENSSAQFNFRSLSMLRNGIGIEKRIKNELLDQGLLDLNDFPNNDDDEILNEIKRVTSELSSVGEHNITTLKRLRESASDEIKRLEIKRKLDTIDQEILEAYKRTMQSKSKRKPLTPEEQQEIFRLTAEQKALSDQLESITVNVYD